MNPAALLGLIGDLYQQIAVLQAENAQLRDQQQGHPLPPSDD